MRRYGHIVAAPENNAARKKLTQCSEISANHDDGVNGNISTLSTGPLWGESIGDALNIAWWFSPNWHTMHTQTPNKRYAVSEFNIWATYVINCTSLLSILCSMASCYFNDSLKCLLRFRLHSDTYTRHSVNHAFYKMGYALEQKRSRHQSMIIFVSIRDRRMWKLY